MPNHDQFEEMCALAAGGELGQPDLQVLNAHLEECSSCRELLAELGEIHAQWLPAAKEEQVEQDAASQAALRKRILKHATQAGARFSRPALLPAEPFFAWNWQAPRGWVLAASAMLMIAVSAWAAVQILALRATPQGTAAAIRPAPLDRELLPVRQNADPAVASKAEVELEATIASFKERQRVLEADLKSRQDRADALEGERSDALRTIGDLKQQLQAARNGQASAEAQLAQLKDAQATAEAVTVAQQQEIERLGQKLSDQSATVDRERQMLASGREIRDLIAARNLHIIDVYDTDARGKTSPAFGRVFYTEGKSLVFYAYDLGGGRTTAGDLAFYVWGKQDGAPQNVRKLGALIKDDKAQQRWVFTLTDPKVLAEIDSVFVTIEPGARAENHPRGKRLLSAYLGSPANHP